jgi:predicted lipid-binding transport protein (Tim44 family)
MRRRSLAAARAFAAVLTAAAALACSPSEEASGDAQAEVEQLLAEYLPRLPEAYRTGDLDPLEGLASPREMDRIESLILDRAKEGQIVDPELKSFEIVQFDLYQHSNAYLTTREVWDLRLRAAGSDRLINEELAKPDRYRYQVRRHDGDGWRILSREVIPPPA